MEILWKIKFSEKGDFRGNSLILEGLLAINQAKKYARNFLSKRKEYG